MKFRFYINFSLHIFITILSTLLTQIGGIIYLIVLLITPNKKSNYRVKRIMTFTLIYLFSTFLVVPNIAPYFGRVKIEDTYRIKSHNYFTKICNRNYVSKNLHDVLNDVSLRLNKEFPNIKLIYLDANFPFIDGFPLLPHLSHNDGKKIDISFIYKNLNGNTTNLKPSNSGYGVYETPFTNELNQNNICYKNGFWQYDMTKFLTFGSNTNQLKLSDKATKRLVQLIINNDKVTKLFIEPHLKSRLNLNNNKVRFHGCSAVRHDDHIHFQIR